MRTGGQKGVGHPSRPRPTSVVFPSLQPVGRCVRMYDRLVRTGDANGYAMKVAVGLTILLSAQAAVGQDDILERPTNCVQQMTVQKRGCELVKIFECPSPDGPVFRSEDYDSEGLDGVSLSDSSQNLILYSDSENQLRVAGGLVRSSAAPSDVVATGKGRADQDVELRLFGLTKPGRIEVDIVLDPTPFMIDETSFRRLMGSVTITFPQPMPTFRGTSINYYHPDTNVMFEGESELGPLGGGEDEIPNSPAAVSFSGQPGFETTVPLFDCGQISSGTNSAAGDLG